MSPCKLKLAYKWLPFLDTHKKDPQALVRNKRRSGWAKSILALFIIFDRAIVFASEEVMAALLWTVWAWFVDASETARFGSSKELFLGLGWCDIKLITSPWYSRQCASILYVLSSWGQFCVSWSSNIDQNGRSSEDVATECTMCIIINITTSKGPIRHRDPTQLVSLGIQERHLQYVTGTSNWSFGVCPERSVWSQILRR